MFEFWLLFCVGVSVRVLVCVRVLVFVGVGVCVADCVVDFSYSRCKQLSVGVLVSVGD